MKTNEDGFTLVELLAVIVILGIIVAIAIPVIGNVTERAKTGADDAQKELAIDAAQLYVVEHGLPTAADNEGVTEEGDAVVLSNDFLFKKGYLEEMSKTINVHVTKVKPGVATDANTQYEFKVP